MHIAGQYSLKVDNIHSCKVLSLLDEFMYPFICFIVDLSLAFSSVNLFFKILV